MAKARKGYAKGMNQDMAKSKTDPMSYYSLSNFRVITEGGSSSGALENEKGTVLSFRLPYIPETNYNGVRVPEQANLKIVGMGTINDTIIIMSTRTITPNPTDSYGQVWAVKYDEETESLIGLSGDYLDINTHLKYNNKINLSTYHKIHRIVGRYESTKIQRIYWTDNYNPVGVLNIGNPDCINTPLNNVELVPSVKFTQPIILDITTGNIPQGTKIQFAYRLLTTDGAETMVGPPTPLVPLPDSSIKVGAFSLFGGDGDPDVDRGNAVTYSVSDIDLNFDVIQHLAILYTVDNAPAVYKFKEEKISSTGSTIVTCSDLQSAIPIPLVEYNIYAPPFSRAKDIETKDQRLVAANIFNTSYEITNYDARAYRYNSAGQALLTDVNEGNITLTGTDFNVPEEHDAINPYNIENVSGWLTNSQYKFQNDGVTIGGSGPNISYKIISEKFQSCTGNAILNDTYSNHIEVNRYTSVEGDFDTKIIKENGSTLKVPRVGQFQNLASPTMMAYTTGYARGEIYRFGIVFYNAKGGTSFVQWIGDIKMPEPTDGEDFRILTNLFGLQSLGIEFTVNTAGLPEDTTGFAIVRVKRESFDKTRLGTGMLMMFERQSDSQNSSLLHRWYALTKGESPVNPFKVDDVTQIYNLDVNGIYQLSDVPGFRQIQMDQTSDRAFTYLISPLGQLYEYNFLTGDYLKNTAHYQANARRYYDNTQGENQVSMGFQYKLYRYTDPPENQWFEIRNGRRLEQGEYIYPETDIITGVSSTNSLANTSYSKNNGADQGVPLGLGSPKVALILSNSPTVPNTTSAASMSWTDTTGFNFTADTSDITNITFSSDALFFKEVAYCRGLFNQYGGASYEDRSKNFYMSCGHYQPIFEGVTSYTNKVFGGDVFVNYYDDEFIQQYLTRESAFKDPYNDPADIDNHISVAACVPVESPVNTDFRTGLHWAANRVGGISADAESTMAAYDSSSYQYNTLWSQQNTSEEKFFIKDFLTTFVEEHPHQLWASENKIDGELVDNWRKFLVNNTTEVNGAYGPINKIINFNDKLLFYQEQAYGTAALDERTLFTATDGQELTVGSGGVFPDYAYISTTTGTLHPFSVVKTNQAVYHWDTRLRKIFRSAGGPPENLSANTGMDSYFTNNITGAISDTDLNLRDASLGGPIGIHAVSNIKENRVIFTFLNHKKGAEVVNTTISYNEFMGAFESFYDYTPGLYLDYGRRLLSVNPFEYGNAHEHGIGPYGVYYNQLPAVSSLNVLLADEGDFIKIFNNLEWQAEVTDTNSADIYNETFSRVQIYNDYQDTGMIPLVNKNNIRRRMRTWHYTIPRSEGTKARIRNGWAHLLFEFDNTNNRRHIIHDIIYSFTPASN